MDLIQKYSKLWTQMQSGSQGLSGKKTINALTMFNQLFEVKEESVIEFTEDEDSDDAINETLKEE